MPYTDEQQFKINLLRKSIRLQSPDVETDPAYQFTDEDLWDILSTVAPAYNLEYDIDTVPKEEFYFVLLLAKKEMYYRLATAMAPLYPLEAEGATLQKNRRFDHYMLLIRQVDREYDKAVNRLADGGTGGQVQTYEVTAISRYYSTRNYNRSQRPVVSLSLSEVTQTSVNCDWTKFDQRRGALFLRYRLYVTPEPIIDEYADPIFQGDRYSGTVFHDIHRLKYRVTGLKPGTKYFATLISEDRNGLFGYDVKEFTTLAEGQSQEPPEGGDSDGEDAAEGD